MSVFPRATALLAPARGLPRRGPGLPPGRREPAPRGRRDADPPRAVPARVRPGHRLLPRQRGPRQAAARTTARSCSRSRPSWPGQWFWADRKTLQFRPAEPWPAAAALRLRGRRRAQGAGDDDVRALGDVAATRDSTDLRPFRTLTLTFPQPLPLAALKKMLRLEIRELPGLADSPTPGGEGLRRSRSSRADNQRSPAVYAITLEEDVPEGKQLRVTVSLALGEEDKVLWTGRLSTRPGLPPPVRAVRLGELRAGGRRLGASGHGALVRQPGRPAAARLLRQRAGPDAHRAQEAGAPGARRPGPALRELRQPRGAARQVRPRHALPDADRPPRPSGTTAAGPLRDPGTSRCSSTWVEDPFLRWNQSTAIVEAKGPRMLPLQGYGDARADVRIYRVDPLHRGPVALPRAPGRHQRGERAALPRRGALPPVNTSGYIGAEELDAHIRLLGSPLVSRVVDLPLAEQERHDRPSAWTSAPLLDPAVGRKRPGTYLVGLRRLTGAPERAYVRVQVTNLSLTAVEERDRAVFFVRTLDEAKEIRGAKIVIEGQRRVPNPKRPGRRSTCPSRCRSPRMTGAGRRSAPQSDWQSIKRISVQSGEDILVLDPREPPATFAQNHWSPSSGFLEWIGQQIPPPPERCAPRVRLHRAAHLPARREGLHQGLTCGGRPVASAPAPSDASDSNTWRLCYLFGSV